MVYTKAYQDNLHGLISSSLKRKKLLYEVIWKEDEDNEKKKLISKKDIKKKKNLSSEIDRVKVEDVKNYMAEKLKLDDAHDFEEAANLVYTNVFIKFQIPNNKYSAELTLNKNKVNNFILGNGVESNSFEVHEGRLFIIKFINKGFNGIVKFKNKIIDYNESYLEEVLFEKGIEKILFRKSFEMSKDISVLRIDGYIITAMVNTVKNLKRKKAVDRKRKKEITTHYITESSNYTKKNEGGLSGEKKINSSESPESSLEKKENQNKMSKILNSLKEYISTNMNPKRAKIFLLYIQYKADESFGSDDIPQSLQDIADIVDVSLGTVKSNIKRAAEQIGEKFQFKSLLEEEEI